MEIIRLARNNIYRISTNDGSYHYDVNSNLV